MTRCWSKDPSQRPSMEEIVKIMTHLMKVSMATAFSPLLRGAGARSSLMFPLPRAELVRQLLLVMCKARVDLTTLNLCSG